jgi:DNA-binding response OmpR family regulator
MRGRVLIIEDESELADLVQMYLQKEGIESEVCHDAETAMERLSVCRFDLLLLDINLPGMDGFELLQNLRPRIDTPVIIVSAREADEDVIMGLGSGADEFVTKPFTPRVLVARIRAMLRRSRTGSSQYRRFGPFSIDLEGYFLRKGEARVPLSSKEFEVLRHLIRHAGRAMSPDEIYVGVWENEYGDSTSVAVYVRRIRQKIEDDPRQPVYIQTIHGKGYRFNPEVLDGGSP